MVDRGVMIGMLLVAEQVQPVQNQPPARTRHNGADVVAGERSAECHRVQIDRAVPALMRLSRGHVIGAGTLALDAMIVYPG